ncbi:MAG: SpoIID/LytB domain-containing protein [Oscillospiraceae bacterium]|nr:SpoIID/LytB domain-containing protein [Oscillospiraceae bacterium]
MKNAVIITLMFFLLLFLVPFLWGQNMPFSGIFAVSDYPAPESFRVLMTESGEVLELSTVDYLIGCLYAQTAPGYSLEALKAQAVAAHTYAIRLSLNNKNRNTSGDSLKDADFSDNSVTCQPYFTEEKAREFYGFEYEFYYNKIKEAAEYGANYVILYNNQPIYAVYHSVSAGITNTPRYIWGVDFPYLKSVPSEWDRDFTNFLCTNEITMPVMRDLLLSFDPNIIMPLDYGQWFSEYSSDNAGYVSAISARNLTVSGGDLWRLLNLRSASFVIEYTEGVFVATTKGYGHGVGLSQYGADYMSKKGYTAQDILEYYYTDVNIVRCSYN